eukprot:SAG31_NODE_851_length_11519_cov_4.727145_8_plen_105_part_00
MNFEDAKAFCRNFFFDLASTHTESQVAAVTDLCSHSSNSPNRCHIGLHDAQRDDTKLDLSNGEGGTTGQTVYTTPSGIVVEVGISDAFPHTIKKNKLSSSLCCT